MKTNGKTNITFLDSNDIEMRPFADRDIYSKNKI